MAAFNRWQAGHATLKALDPAAMDLQAEQDCWVPIDRADEEVHDLPASTAAGIACKLYLALYHNTTDAEPEAAAIRGDLEWFEARGQAIDWHLRCIVSALRALEKMEG